MSVFVFKWYYSRISVLSLVPIYGESGRMILINLVQSRRRLIFLYHSVCFYEFSRPSLSQPASWMETARSAWRPYVSSESERVMAHWETNEENPATLDHLPPRRGSLQMFEPLVVSTPGTSVGPAMPKAETSRTRVGKFILCLHHIICLCSTTRRHTILKPSSSLLELLLVVVKCRHLSTYHVPSATASHLPECSQSSVR